jgi:polyferredoxin
MLAASNFTINSTHVLLIFLAFILSTIIATIIRKILYRIKYAKRYFIFPKISVKGIANVAMVIAIAIAAILLLTIVTAGFFGVIFRAYPG